MSKSTLDILKSHTKIVADTGDFDLIKAYCPIDATTNPSLILAASKLIQYSHLLDVAVAYSQKIGGSVDQQIESALEKVFVLFGYEILKVIKGRVSTEVDARHSFSIDKQIEVARRLIEMYEEMGVNRERVLIKLSSTWEGIRAAELLESKYGIHCNLTLMFSMCQAIACAQAGVTLISPFVGRVLDWHTTKFGKQSYDRFTDPGVQLVTQIYHYYKQNNYKTEIMGASFRNVEQILGLTGCDLLTISPGLLKELSEMTESPALLLTPKSDNYKSGNNNAVKSEVELNEQQFRWLLNEDEMATDKLADGIRRFANDSIKLADLIKQRLIE